MSKDTSAPFVATQTVSGVTGRPVACDCVTRGGPEKLPCLIKCTEPDEPDEAGAPGAS